MNLCFNIRYLSKSVGLDAAAKALSGAGFTLLDYTPPLTDCDWQAEVEMASEVFSRYGLSVYQCHAPFNRYKRWGSAEHHKVCVMASLSAAERLGAKYLVVHGDEFDFENQAYSPKTALDYNYNYFAPLVEQAAKTGVSIAFENVFEDMGLPRYGSKTEELCALIDRFGGDVCCCWDFGHGAVAYGEKNAEAISDMKGRIKCTHVHDNYLNADTHLLPFYGKIDWKRALQALKTGGIPEVFSFELVYGTIPAPVAESAAKHLFDIGKTLWELVPR